MKFSFTIIVILFNIIYSQCDGCNIIFEYWDWENDSLVVCDTIITTPEDCNTGDLQVLQEFIDNSAGTLNMDMDINGNGIIEPLELGAQTWENGRLLVLDCHWDGFFQWEYCELSGELPYSIGSISYLETLVLHNNQLIGSIPESIGNLTSLRLLALTNNQLTGNIPAGIENLFNLKSIGLEYNQLSGSIPENIGYLNNLSNLFVNNNLLSGSIPESIEQANLKYLFLSTNQLIGSIPENIGNLTNLIGLTINDNQITGEIPLSLGNLSNLEVLYLSGNQLIGNVPEGICNLNVPFYLSPYYFSIFNNNLCTPYPYCIEDYMGEQECIPCVDGDLNTDENIDVLDIVVLVNIILSPELPSEVELCRGDLNDDEEINILDIVIVIDIVLNE